MLKYQINAQTYLEQWFEDSDKMFGGFLACWIAWVISSSSKTTSPLSWSLDTTLKSTFTNT